MNGEDLGELVQGVGLLLLVLPMLAWGLFGDWLFAVEHPVSSWVCAVALSALAVSVFLLLGAAWSLELAPLRALLGWLVAGVVGLVVYGVLVAGRWVCRAWRRMQVRGGTLR